MTFEVALDGLDLPLLFPVAAATGTTPLSIGTMNTTPAVSVIVPGTSEVQTVSVTSTNGAVLVGGNTAGTFTLSFGGQTTSAIPGATPTQVQTALNSLTATGNDVSVAGVIGDYTLTFENALVGTPLSAVTGSPSGGATIAVNPSFFNLVFNGQTTSNLAYNDSAADVQNQLSALSGIGAGNISVTSSTTTTDAVYVSGITTGGSFQLIYGGQSAGITYGAEAAQVQTALNELTSIANPNTVASLSSPIPYVTVIGAGTPASPYLITFYGSLGSNVDRHAPRPWETWVPWRRSTSLRWRRRITKSVSSAH